MQDLVAIGVADAREQVGIGQGAFHGVVADEQSRTELIEGGVERFQTTSIEFGQRVLAAQEVNRGPLLRRSFGQQQRAVREVEGRQTDLAGDRRALLFPAEAAGDHQVDGQEELALELEDEALA